MRKLLLSTLVLGLLLCGFGVAAATAAEAKPIATLAFSGYDELMKDVECIGKLSGQPDLAKGLEGMIAAQTQGKGPVGLDKSRPWGVVVLAGDEPMPTGYAFIPVAKLEDLLAVLKNVGVEISEPVDGISEVSGPKGKSVFVKQQGDWAYVCLSKEGFAAVDADPAKLLGDAAKQYNLSLRINVQNIPASLRDTAMGMLEMGMQAGMQKMPGESDEDYDLRMKMTKDSLEQTKKVFAEMDSVFLGAAVDEKTGSANIDVEQTALAGTDAAKQMSAVKKGKTDFGGFYQPDAAWTFCSFATLDKKQQEQMKNTLIMYRTMLERAIDEQELDDEEQAKAKKLTADIVKVFEDSIAAEKMDMGAALSLAPAKSTLIGGATIADGSAVDKIVRELAEIAKAEHPEAAEMLKLDAAEHAGIKLHSLSFPLPEEMDNREQITALIGEKVELIVGVGEKQLYLAAGDGALDKLKAAIDKSKADAEQEISPMRMSLSVAPIAKLAGELAEDFTAKMVASSIGSALETAGGDDRVTITGESIPNGVRYRITLQKGILKILGMIPAMAGGM